MPEAPELQVVAEFLNSHLLGEKIARASVLRPSVVRSIAADLESDAAGRSFQSAERRGKFLLIGLSGDRGIVINPKLTGALQSCPGKTRVQKRACVRIELESGDDLRYADDRQMGQFYYTTAAGMNDVPGIAEQGPDVLDDFTLAEFEERLKKFHGEIKGVLARGRVISGIGNAYVDEILFDARVYPFKRRKALSPDERRRIYESSRRVILEAADHIRQRMGDRIDRKMRDFLKVHNRGGQPCPRCANRITELRANQRITSYCRKCQPGMLLSN